MTSQPLPASTSVVVNSFTRHDLGPDTLWEWACNALEIGADTLSVRLLAGCTPPADPEDAARFFLAACHELGIAQPPSHEAALRDRLWILATEFLSGRLSADDTLAQAHRQVISPL